MGLKTRCKIDSESKQAQPTAGPAGFGAQAGWRLQFKHSIILINLGQSAKSVHNHPVHCEVVHSAFIGRGSTIK